MNRWTLQTIGFIELLNDLSALLSDDPLLVDGFNELLPTEFKLKIKETNREESSTSKRPRRESTSSDEPCAKKSKPVHQSIGKLYSMYGSWKEFSFFDKVKQLLGNECTYLNFLRCIELFNRNLIDGIELYEILQPFISKSPSILTQLKSMLRHHLTSCSNQLARKGHKKDGQAVSLDEEIKEYEIDFSSCRKMGSSYRALKVRPEMKPVCSGRTDLCKQVLNDVWVSFPLWSEDPATTSESHGGCKITSIQEFFYKCEDERFELDIVIDQVTSTIKTLEEVQNKMNSMSQEEIVSFQLDDSLGGSSQVLQRKVIERIYGDKAKDLLEGLKMKPFIGVPIALRRLKAKQQEWMEHRVKFNKIWKENTEKHSQRALNCELASVKQNDHKDARTKVIINEMEAIHDESLVLSSIYGDNSAMKGKHFVYSDKETFNDVNNLIEFNLACMSEDRTGGTPSAGVFSLPSGSTPTITTPSVVPLLSTDTNVLSFCKKALHFLSILNDGKDILTIPSFSGLNDSMIVSTLGNRINHINGHNSHSINGCRDGNTSPPGINPSEHLNTFASSRSPSSEVVMYQTSRWLVMVSLHHKLYSRLAKIRHVSERESLDRDMLERDDRKRSKALYLDIDGKEECGTLYSFAMTVLRSCVGGACEPGTYEEHVRKTIAKVKNGSSFNYNDVSYWIISLDKLLKNVIRELHQLAGDETSRKGMELFETFQLQKHRSPLIGSLGHVTYRHNSLNLFSRDFCYKFTFKKNWNKIVAELVDSTCGEFSREGASKIHKLQKWQEYISDFISNEACEVPSMPFMTRNLRKEVPADLMVTGSDQFAFKPNSFRLVFSSSSHSVLHRGGRICYNDESFKIHAFNRYNKFLKHWNKWQSSHVTPLNDQKFFDWMTGIKKNQTKILEVYDGDEPPYRPYKKFLSIHKT